MIQTEINDFKENVQQTKNELQNMSKDHGDLQMKYKIALDENKNYKQELCSRVGEIKTYQEEINLLNDKLHAKLRENDKINVENVSNGFEVEELNVQNNTIFF